MPGFCPSQLQPLRQWLELSISSARFTGLFSGEHSISEHLFDSLHLHDSTEADILLKHCLTALLLGSNVPHIVRSSKLLTSPESFSYSLCIAAANKSNKLIRLLVESVQLSASEVC